MPVDSRFIEFSKPFIDATKNIFETMVFSKLDNQKPSFKMNTTILGDVTSFINLSGEINQNGVKQPYEAILVISFPYDTYFKIAHAMLGETHTSYSSEIKDLGSEIVNMVMGNAKKDLLPLGYSSSMAIPVIFEGKNSPIIYPNEKRIVLIPFDCNHGSFFMELCFKEK